MIHACYFQGNNVFPFFFPLVINGFLKLYFKIEIMLKFFFTDKFDPLLWI